MKIYYIKKNHTRKKYPEKHTHTYFNYLMNTITFFNMHTHILNRVEEHVRERDKAKKAKK